jgi:hypothetical protein
VDYRQDPGPHAPPFGPVARRPPPDLDKSVLDQVLGRLPLAHHPVGQGEGRAAVAIIQRGERASASPASTKEIRSSSSRIKYCRPRSAIPRFYGSVATTDHPGPPSAGRKRV